MTALGIAFRPLARHDLADIASWLAQPHVARWWLDRSDIAAVEAEYAPVIDGHEPTEVFVIEVEGRSIGFIQRYLIDDHPDWAETMRKTGAVDDPAAGIDYLIGDPVMVGQGIGSAAIGVFTALTFARYQRAEMVIAAPQQANAASWRALERAGFTRLWAGRLDSDDPSDAGPAYLYGNRRQPVGYLTTR
jgi:aminoglycoside 6'-N-acetyltransferase